MLFPFAKFPASSTASAHSAEKTTQPSLSSKKDRRQPQVCVMAGSGEVVRLEGLEGSDMVFMAGVVGFGECECLLFRKTVLGFFVVVGLSIMCLH